MVVIVRAGRTDRVGVAVDDEEQPVSGGEQEAARQPTGLRRQFRKQSEKSDSQQDARAEGHHHLHALAQAREPQSQRRACDADDGS